MSRLRETGLKLEPEKCKYLQPNLEYVGHIVTADGVKPNPAKITAVKGFKVPKCLKDIESFLGLAGYYRKFLKNFSHLAKPLTELTKKGNPFKWTSKHQKAFNQLKTSLCTSPVLSYPDYKKEFLLTTDALNLGLGAVLTIVFIFFSQTERIECYR